LGNWWVKLYIMQLRYIHLRTERARLNRTKDIKQRLEVAKHQLDVAQRQGEYEKASRLRFSTIPDLQRQLPDESERSQSENAETPLAMLHDRVTSNDIARVVARSTGIPVQNLLKGERDKLVHVSTRAFIVHSAAEMRPRWRILCVDEWSDRTMSLRQ
jgi:ATP-dependent Clp protease ATP-binding subunit ClpA